MLTPLIGKFVGFLGLLCLFFQNFALCGQLINGTVKFYKNINIALFSLRMISFTFKEKIQKTKRIFFFCSYFNILDTNLIRNDEKMKRSKKKML